MKDWLHKILFNSVKQIEPRVKVKRIDTSMCTMASFPYEDHKLEAQLGG